jgi:Fe-S cluster biosynthesis and repair protein YggX
MSIQIGAVNVKKKYSEIISYTWRTWKQEKTGIKIDNLLEKLNAIYKKNLSEEKFTFRKKIK